MTPRTAWILGSVAVLALGALLVARRRTSLFVVLASYLPAALVVFACGVPHLAPTARPPFSVHFTPLLLLAPAAAGLVLWLRGRELDARLARTRARLHAGVLGAAFAVLALLFGEAEGLTWKSDQTRVVVWDVSRSAERAGVTSLRREAELRLAERSMHAGDRLALVEFAGRAELTVPLHAKGEPTARLESNLPRDLTHLEAGLRRALSEVPTDAAAKVVVVSDGVENRGDVLRALAPARARGIAVDTVALDYVPPADLELHAVRGPARAATGQPFDLRVETSAPPGASVPATLVVERDGKPWQRRAVSLAGGHDVVQLPLEETEAGLHRYAVELHADAGNPILDNDKQTTFVEVTGARSALLLSGLTPGPSPIEGMLHEAGFEVQRAKPSDTFDDVADFAAKDLVVLEDVPAMLLGEARIKALARAVQDVGTGLLLIGGKHAFGPGGYGGSALEEASPVSFDLKKDKKKPPLAEIILIDYSGSMAAEVDGQTKLSLANEAAARSAGLLSPGDRVAVAHVDTDVKWTVPLQLVRDGNVLGPQIRAVAPGGGGIYSDLALKTAYAALREVPAGTLKHVLLFADGSDAEQIASCPALATAASASDITTSVVSLGRGSDSTTLEQVSTAGGGRFYLVEDARTLPEVFSQETVLASRRAFREEPITPVVVNDGGLFRGVRALPQLDGYVVTLAKGGARVSVAGPEDEPILADWSHGLGKVGVFTSDLAGLWSAAWLASPDAVRLTTQLAISLARTPTPPGARLAATTRRGEIAIEASDALADANGSQLLARVLSPDGSEHDVPLDEIARGAFEGNLRADASGTHVVTLVRRQGPGAEQLIARTAVVLGANDELAPRPTNKVLLERMSSETGGLVRATLENLFDGERHDYATRADLSLPLVVALTALLVAMVMTRRLVWPSWQRKAVAPSGPAPELPTLALAQKRTRIAPAAAPFVPVVAPQAAPREAPPPAAPAEEERELTAVERIAARRREKR